MSNQEEHPFLVVGLGNPGEEYEYSWHNIGFRAVDLLAKRFSASHYQNKFHGEWVSVSIETPFLFKKLHLLKPQTYMNRSGLSVQKACQFYQIPPETHLLLVSDDMDLPKGELRLRLQGSSGGHNGLRSIIQALGSESFARLRVGIGRTEDEDESNPDFLLKRLKNAEKKEFESLSEQAAEAVEKCLKLGVTKAMNQVNTGPKPETKDEK